jgi:hypothetical protein
MLLPSLKTVEVTGIPIERKNSSVSENQFSAILKNEILHHLPPNK